VDIDNGMHRTGIEPGRALSLIHSIVGNKSFIFRGLHIYDGHIHDRDPVQRKIHCEKDFEVVDMLAGKLEQEGIAVHEMACGGTPTFPVHASHPDRTLCPGTPLLWDAGYSQSFPDLDFLPAAVVAGRVISKDGQRLSLDLGYKAVASEMNHPRLKFLEMEPGEVINHSEEHLVIASPDADKHAIGEVVYALPMHICPTIALHEKVYVVRDREVKETWDVVARKRIYSL
jgi:D-serine deaminase-like pyridoxal phosphate-dependent protein